MNSQRQIAILFLTLTLGAAPIVAQQQTPEGAVDPAAQPPAQTGEPVAEPAEQDSAAEKPGAAASSTKDSPFDYRSSEEISEDLSVSFPVDI